MIDNDIPIKALAPWYGSNRMLAEHVGKLLDGCTWIGVPFAGGMTELLHFKARTILANDKHHGIINLARVAACPRTGPMLYRRLRRLLFHPTTLDYAQVACFDMEQLPKGPVVPEDEMIDWAENYFVAMWMARSANAGTANELDGNLCLRWNAGGGDSVVRYRNAAKSLLAWRKAVLERCSFSTLDAFEFLDRCNDTEGTGIYNDPPFPGPGDKYKHTFSIEDHKRLAVKLASYKHARCVCRFYDHPLIRELYPESRWTWLTLEGRKQSNAKAPEVLLVNVRGEAELF